MGCGTWTLTECIRGMHKVRNTAWKPKFGDKGGELEKQPAKKKYIIIKGVKLRKPSIFVVI
jgi:hypothetical protein